MIPETGRDLKLIPHIAFFCCTSTISSLAFRLVVVILYPGRTGTTLQRSG
jgi:hypothetical protein